MAHRVRIVAVPAGEAPQWVREKWVGLELPLAQWTAGPRTRRTAGVLSGPRDVLAMIAGLFSGRLNRRTGYVVDVQAAIAALERVSPEAAAWWRTAAPHLLTPGRRFMFQEHACHLVRDA